MLKRRMTGVTVLGAVGMIALFAACGSNDDTGPSSDNAAGNGGADDGTKGPIGVGGSDEASDGGEPSTSTGEGGEGGNGNEPSAVQATPSDFTPSNLPADLDIEVEEDFIINGETCGTAAELNTDTGELDCDNGTPVYAFKIVEQDDGSEISVFAGRNIVVAPTVTVTVVGQRPLVLLAPGDVQIGGAIYAIADDISGYRANAGGFSGVEDEQTKGQGPGGGSGASSEAGGGAYCGKGGKGGSASGAPGGVAYGSEEISPLIGGSSGGSGDLGGVGGAGGGAVQVIAGGKLSLTATGVIHVGGAGGGWNGGGGGSGGSILLEGNELVIAGTLAANGGGGGEGTAVNGESGLNASPDAVPAPSGSGSEETDDDGGIGSAADVVVGGNGSATSGGGGGGAGRIRLNSKSGEAKVSGVLSPSADSACVTQGTLG